VIKLQYAMRCLTLHEILPTAVETTWLIGWRGVKRWGEKGRTTVRATASVLCEFQKQLQWRNLSFLDAKISLKHKHTHKFGTNTLSSDPPSHRPLATQHTTTSTE